MSSKPTTIGEAWQKNPETIKKEKQTKQKTRERERENERRIEKRGRKWRKARRMTEEWRAKDKESNNRLKDY